MSIYSFYCLTLLELTVLVDALLYEIRSSEAKFNCSRTSPSCMSSSRRSSSRVRSAL